MMSEGPVHYRHTQVGTVMLVAMAAGVLLLLVVAVKVGLGPPPVALGLGVTLFALLVVMVLFTSLTVTVDAAALEIRFGPGPIRKRWELSQILGARAVRNHWVWGWGIRITPHGWLYNVSGLDAVELSLSGGSNCRVGTDDPRGLLRALREASGGRIEVPDDDVFRGHYG